MVTHPIATAVGGGGGGGEGVNKLRKQINKNNENPQSLCRVSVYIVRTLLKANNLLNR